MANGFIGAVLVNPSRPGEPPIFSSGDTTASELGIGSGRLSVFDMKKTVERLQAGPYGFRLCKSARPLLFPYDTGVLMGFLRAETAISVHFAGRWGFEKGWSFSL